MAGTVDQYQLLLIEVDPSVPDFGQVCDHGGHMSTLG